MGGVRQAGPAPDQGAGGRLLGMGLVGERGCEQLTGRSCHLVEIPVKLSVEGTVCLLAFYYIRL